MLSLEAKDNPFDSLVEFIRALLAPSTDEQRGVSSAVRAGWAENFTGERSGTGQAWAQLRPFTVRERQARGYPGAHPILVQSGALRSSLLIPGATNSHEELRSDGSGWTLEIGTTDPKALKHELGEGRIPARPFIELSSNAQNDVLTALDAMLARIEARTLDR